MTPRPTTKDLARAARYRTNRANQETCKKCGHSIICGWESEPMAGLVTLDPYTLTPGQETACLLYLNKYTVELDGRPGHWRIKRLRTGWGKVFAWGAPDHPVLPQHVCGTPPPSQTKLEYKQPQPEIKNGEPPY